MWTHITTSAFQDYNNMPRCNKCSTCLSVIDFRKQNKKNRTKIKRFEFNNACEDTTLPIKKRRLTEVQALNTAGCKVDSGRVVGLLSPPNISSPLDERSARPNGDLNEDIYFNVEKYDEYAELVLQCTQTLEASQSSDVVSEGPSMIAKMRGLLDPSVKFEVDYDEAVKDISHVLFMWKMDGAAGKRAFIPDIADRDLCYNAVKIFSHAMEEAELIPKEFCKEFGKFGTTVYNTLLGIIGERDKNCIPFVNMCLRTWLKRLSVDPDTWSDTYLFDFDKWVEDSLAKPTLSDHHCHGGKTSYELMMAVFGNKEEIDNTPPTTSQRQITRQGQIKSSYPTANIEKNAQARATISATPSAWSSAMSIHRMSKLEKAGKK